MAYGVSETSIANAALLRVGSKPITSMDDENDRADTCKRLYPYVRDSLLTEHEWGFCIQRASLSRLVDAPSFGFLYQYQIPGDVLKLIEIYSSTKAFHQFKWHREGTAILTDQEDISIVYKAKVTDTTQFPADFRMALESKLAAQIAYPLRKDARLSQFLYRQSLVDLENAMMSDTREGDFRNVPEEDLDFDFNPLLDVR